MNKSTQPGQRGSVDDVVLPCENLDVEVVSDIVEEIADIEVIAEPVEDPIPDLDIQATLEHSTPAGDSEEAASPGKPPEPDYDVEVTAVVKDEEQEDIEVLATVQDSPVTDQPAGSEPGNAATGPAEEAIAAPPAAQRPDVEVEVECQVIDAVEPDLEITCTVVEDSQEPRGGGERA